MSDFAGLSPGRGRSSHYGGSPPAETRTHPISNFTRPSHGRSSHYASPPPAETSTHPRNNFTRPSPSHGRSSHYGGSPPEESGGTRPTAQRGTSTGAPTGDGQ